MKTEKHGLLIRFALSVWIIFVCRVAPNCVIKAKSVRTRVFVSDEIEECKDLSGLYYLLPFQKVTKLSLAYIIR